MNDDLIDLQTQVSFQEDTIAQLNIVVTRQQRELTDLLREVQQLKKLSHSLLEHIKQDIVESKPPHY